MASPSIPLTVPRHRSVWAVPLSVLAHAGLVAALVLSVAWKSETPPALQAELWEAIPSSPPPAPVVLAAKPEPKPAPEPEPTKPAVLKAPSPEPDAIAPKVIKKIVKTPEPEPTPEPVKKSIKPTPKPDVKVEPTPVPKVLPPIEPPPVVPDTKARDEARAREVARMNQLSQTTTVSAPVSAAPVVGTPQAGSAQGLGAGWAAKLKACVQPRLNYRDINGDNPRVVIVVALSPTGSPSNPVVSKSSGNTVFDDAVARALLGCNPFPKPESGNYPPSVPVAYRLND